MADTTLFVARPDDVAALRTHFEAARAGSSRTVLLSAPLGGGKRAVVGELVRSLPQDEDTLVIRVPLTDEEDGIRTLMNRFYGAVYGSLVRDPGLRGRVEMILSAQLPQHPKRVQNWFQAFIEGVKKATPVEGEQSLQIQVSNDNPLLGLVEVLAGISRKMTTVLEIQNVHAAQSVTIFQLIEALHESRKDGKLLLILGHEPVDEAAKAWMAEPLLDFLTRRADELQRVELAPWGAEEVTAYASSKGLVVGAPERVAEMAHGRPAYIAELLDVLSASNRIGDALEGETLISLAPSAPDEDELEDAPPPEEGKRRHATAKDASRVQFLASLLGLAFPSRLIADMDGLDPDSVDDLFDATGDMIAELQFSKPLGTWIYQFKRGIWRQAVIDAHQTDEDHRLAMNVAAWMERFWVPRGYEYIVKTSRMFAEHAAKLEAEDARRAGFARAMQLRMAALTADRLDGWSMSLDLMRHFEQISWPEPLRRIVYSNLVDHMVQNGRVDPEQAEKLVQEVLAFAKERGDKGLEAWTLFAGSRLDMRRQDMYRARDRARDALKMYAGFDAKGKVAECENHLAMVEFQDGNVNASLDHLNRALEASSTPPVQAQVEFIKGLIDRRGGKWADAAERFRKANEIASSTNLAALALEAGFHYGEALVQSGQNLKAADILLKVAQIASALRNPMRERGAVFLLSQAQGRLRNYEAALQWSQRTLQLTQELKLEQLYAADIYWVAFYQLQLGRFTEAQSLFGKAAERAPADNPGLLREIHFYSGVSALRIGEKSGATRSFREALRHAQATKDWSKIMQASEHLADMEFERGDKNAAARLLQDALKAAEQGNLREERKGIRKKLDEISG